MKSVKNGSYSDPSVWDASGGDRQVLHHVWIDKDVQCNERLYVSGNGKIEWRGATITMNNKNFVVVSRNGMYNRPVAGKKAGITFAGLLANQPVGSGMLELPTDVGIWTFNSPKIDIEGTFKTPYTYLTTGVNSGAATITVQNAQGWNVGDEITVGTMEMPFGTVGLGWNEQDTVFNDEFFKRFEKRTIKNISGNTITLSSALTYNHATVVTNYGSIHQCPVVNHTRDFVIQGTEGRPAHWFNTAHNEQGQHSQHDVVPVNIKNIELKYMGQRHPGKHGGLVNGRYPLHFHHCGDSTQGSIIENVAAHVITNRCYVPHQSNGITMKNCTVVDCLNQGFWWDDRENSHEINWDGNIGMGCRWDGTGGHGEGMLLGMGDGNIARRNRMYYCNSGEIHNNNGAYAWNANSEGVWIFEDNKGFCSTCDNFVWQNTGNNHTIVRHEAVNCLEAAQHGAYTNSYQYIECKYHRALFFIEATSGNTHGVVMDRCIFDAGGREFGSIMQDSPIQSDSRKTNKYLKCQFMGHTIAGVQMTSPLPVTHPDKMIKNVDFILCTWSGELFVFDGTQSFKNGYRIRVMPEVGQSWQKITQNGQIVKTNIADFAPKIWGNGTGLKGDYYTGSNFETLQVTRIDSMIMFQGWSPDPNYATYGVHHKVQGDAYSMKWKGKIMAQVSGTHHFGAESWGGVRIWVNGQKLVDLWAEFNDRVIRYGNSINLTAGQSYDYEAHHFNSGSARGMMLHWKAAGLEDDAVLPVTQLFPATGTQPPPTEFKSVEIHGVYKKNDCTTGVGSDVHVHVPAGAYTGATQAEADQKAQAFAQSEANRLGTCSIVPVDVCKQYVESDYLYLQPDVAKAVNEGHQFETGYQHYEAYGKNETVDGQYPGGRRCNKLCTSDDYWQSLEEEEGEEFLSAAINKEYQKNNCTEGVGSMVMITLEEGSFTSDISQADADEQADVWAQNEANRLGTCLTEPPPEVHLIGVYEVYSDGTWVKIG